MKYIEIKYKGNGAPRSGLISMGGFMLEAPHKFQNGRELIRRGQLGLQFKLEIPPDGECRVPDTEHNRIVLRIHCFPRTDTMYREKIVAGEAVLDDNNEPVRISYKKKFPATYELISKIDLKDDAPDKPEKTYTQAEMEAIIAKTILDNQGKKQMTDDEKKKAQAELKEKQQAAKDEEKRLDALEEEEERHLRTLENESDKEREARIHKERFANKIG